VHEDEGLPDILIVRDGIQEVLRLSGADRACGAFGHFVVLGRRECLRPVGLVHLDRLGPRRSDLFNPFRSVVLGIKNETQNVLVSEMIVGRPVALGPDLLGKRTCEIVVATNVENWRFQRVDPPVVLFPFFDVLRSINVSTLDQVTNADHELRAQQVQLRHRNLEDLWPFSPGQI